MIKTVTVIDNTDGTQQLYFHNFNGHGSEIKVDRANVLFNIKRNDDYFNRMTAEIILKADCLINNKGELYSIYLPKSDLRNSTSEELLEELKRRNVLSQETVYKVNK